MKKIVLISAICLSVFITEVVAQTSSSENKIRIDFGSAMGGYVSEYFSNVNFIVFDTDPKAIFGKIDQLEVTHDYYIILDKDTKSIIIFDKTGKFHSRIDGNKLNQQFPHIYSFGYDRDKKTIIFTIRSEVYTYDLNGLLLNRKKTTFEDNKGPQLYLGNGYFGSYKYSPMYTYQSRDSIAYELMLLKNNIVEAKYLPYATAIPYDDSQGSQSTINFTRNAGNKDTLYFTRDYDYKIYELTKENLRTPYEFIFSVDKSLPENFRINTELNGKRQAFFSTNRPIIYKLANFYTSRNKILFRILTSDYKSSSYIYDLTSHKLVSIDKIVSDESTFYLPITDSEVNGMDFLNHGIIGADGESFYTSYSSGVLFFQMSMSKSKHPRYPAHLKDYLAKKKNKKGNPVLVQFKLKDRI